MLQLENFLVSYLAAKPATLIEGTWRVLCCLLGESDERDTMVPSVCDHGLLERAVPPDGEVFGRVFDDQLASLDHLFDLLENFLAAVLAGLLRLLLEQLLVLFLKDRVL